MITVTCKAREGQTKGAVKRLRQEGFIPFVVYAGSKTASSGSVPRHEIEEAMRTIRPGFLPTTVFCLKDENGKSREVIVRDIQYKPTTYEILHIDFLELHNETAIEIKVPVELTNTVDCIGVKLGGFLQTVMRHLRVKCLPKEIPSHFELDVKELNIGQTKRVKEVSFPAGVTCLEAMENVVVTIAKR